MPSENVSVLCGKVRVGGCRREGEQRQFVHGPVSNGTERRADVHLVDGDRDGLGVGGHAVGYDDRDVMRVGTLSFCGRPREDAACRDGCARGSAGGERERERLRRKVAVSRCCREGEFNEFVGGLVADRIEHRRGTDRDRDGLGVRASHAVGHHDRDRVAARALRLGGRPGEDATGGDGRARGSTRVERERERLRRDVAVGRSRREGELGAARSRSCCRWRRAPEQR